MTEYEVREEDGRIRGPVSSSTLRTLAREGAIGPSAEVRKVGSERWHVASSVGGLFEPNADAAPSPAPERPARTTPLPAILGYAALALGLLVAVLQWTDTPAAVWYGLLATSISLGCGAAALGRLEPASRPLVIAGVLLPLAVLANGYLLRERVTAGLAEIQAAAMEDAARRMFSPGRPAVSDGQ